MRNIAPFFLLILVLAVSSANAAITSKAPNVDLTPEQVVRIVIDALKSNDPANNDDGIATVFKFASPENKSSTGPLNRFTKMIKLGFGQMLNHTDSEFGQMEITDDTALQAVWLKARDGKEIGYVFQIGKQTGGEFDGMWMTEAVWPIGEKKPSGQSI